MIELFSRDRPLSKAALELLRELDSIPMDQKLQALRTYARATAGRY